MFSFVQFFLLVFVLTTSFLVSEVEVSASVTFIPCILLALLPILKERRLSLLSAFGVAFAYMIPPEAIMMADALNIAWGVENVRIGYRVLMVSYFAFYVGFLLGAPSKHSLPQKHQNTSIPSLIFKGRNWMILCTIFLVVLFSPMIVYGLTIGRGSSSLYNSSEGGGLLFGVGVLGYFLFGMTYMASAFWGFYALKLSPRNALVKAGIFVFPLLILGIATGTRYYVCFIFCACFIPLFMRLSVYRILVCGMLGFLLLGVASLMKDGRYEGLFSKLGQEDSVVVDNKSPVIALAEKGSPEGLLRNMAMINLHTSIHSHTYGKSIGFLTIFWIPRFIWKDKPTQIDYWLIREYENGFTASYSTASSFCGELFMDFGYGCVIICGLWGWGIGRLDRLLSSVSNESYFYYALTGMSFAWVFFSTRSVITSTVSFVFGVFCAYVFSRVVLKEKIRRTLRFLPARTQKP